MSDFGLLRGEERDYELRIENGLFTISGDYWVYHISDLYKRKNANDVIPLNEFLGVSVLKMRPLRYVNVFIMLPIIINLISQVVHHWIFRILSASEGVQHFVSAGNTLIKILSLLFIIHGIRLLFSLKDLIEISFNSRNICIPRKSLSDLQYQTLIRTLKEGR